MGDTKPLAGRARVLARRKQVCIAGITQKLDLVYAGLRTATNDSHFDRQVIHFRKFLLETKKFRGRLAPGPTRRKSLLSQI
jgi:hypothetical protein